MKKSLYQIKQDYLTIAEQLEENELTPELEKALIINQEELQVKAVNYGYVIKSIDDDLTAISEEIKRLQALKKVKENAKGRLKEAISQAMQHYNIEKVEVPTLKLSFRTSKAIEIVDQDKINNKYIVEKTTYSPNKTAIKKAIESGENVDGAMLVTNQNLQIK